MLDEDLHENDEEMESLESLSRLKRSLPNLKKKLNLSVNISVGEILINALTLVKKHNWSHTETENLLKFALSVLNSGKLFFTSRYLIDEHFYSKEDMTYFFYCWQCSKELGSVRAKNPRPSQVVCPSCATVNMLSDLSQVSYFVTFHLPSQIDILLTDINIRRKLMNPSDFAEFPDDGSMTDLHHGTMYRKFAAFVKSQEELTTSKFLSITLSVDSAALSQTCSGQSICPCFAMINELPFVLRTQNLLLAGLWFGKKKEKMDLFLPPVINHIVSLSQGGFTLKFPEQNEEWHMKLFLIACCADSVARCDIQGIHSHRGDFPCSWCLVEGEEYEGVRIFRHSVHPPPPRTVQGLQKDAAEALRTKRFVHGVKYLCPLAPAPYFHPVHGFVVDPMHARDEGTTKSFLKAWLGEYGAAKDFYIGAPNTIKKIDALLEKVSPPKEFRKAVRSLSEYAFWTGRELENWALYLSVPVLTDILSPRYLKHWAMYVQANYILLQSKLNLSAIKIAEDLLKQFRSKVESMYNALMMRFNLHITDHFAENCRRWGPLFAISAYGFEHGNQRLKKMIHNSQYIASQICRSFSEEQAMRILKLQCESVNTKLFEEEIDSNIPRSLNDVGKVKLLHKGKIYTPTDEEQWYLGRKGINPSQLTLYTEILKDGCCYGMSHRHSKKNNSFARLADNKIVVINKILVNEMTETILIFAQRVWCQPAPICPPSVVAFDANLCFLYTVSNIDEDVSLYDVSELCTVCVSLKFRHGHYIVPMCNVLNMF